MDIEEIHDYDQHLSYLPRPDGALIIGSGDISKSIFAHLVRAGDIWLYTNEASSFPINPHEGDLWINY